MKDKSGIYKIVNLINNKIYVGSATNLLSRKRTHFSELRYGKHTNKYLQNSYNKYGKNNFKFEVIEYVLNINDLIKKEQYWMDFLNVYDNKIGYNISPTAGSNLGIKLSNKTKRKISRSNKNKKRTEECIENNRIKHTGKKHTEETKKKMSENRKGHPCTDTTKKKISEGNSRKVINLDTGEVFNSIKIAAKKYNIKHQTNISKVCRNLDKTCGGYRWRYLDKSS